VYKRQAQLQGLDLSDAKMYWAVLTGADLSFANLSRTDLRGAVLDDAICRHANFSLANLGRDQFNKGSSICGTDFSGAELTGANLKGAIYDDKTKFPDGFELNSHELVHLSTLPQDDPRRKRLQQ
jgi:uncharacterized protein YjbI with pentapeptide repeats